MQRIAFAIAIVTGVAVTSVSADPPWGLSGAAKMELKALEGKWRAEKFLHSDRETTPGADGVPFVVTIAGGKIDFAGLKLKLLSSIVAISAVALLQAFLNVKNVTDRDLMWLVGIHLTFVGSGVLMALTDKISGDH